MTTTADIQESGQRLEFGQNLLGSTTWHADIPEGPLPGGATRLYIREDSKRRRGFRLSYMYPAVGERRAPAPYDQTYRDFDSAADAANRWVGTA